MDKIEDEDALSMLMEDALMYQTTKKEEVDADGLTAAQWAEIEESEKEIEAGNFYTLEQVKAQFSPWLTK